MPSIPSQPYCSGLIPRTHPATSAPANVTESSPPSRLEWVYISDHSHNALKDQVTRGDYPTKIKAQMTINAINDKQLIPSTSKKRKRQEEANENFEYIRTTDPGTLKINIKANGHGQYDIDINKIDFEARMIPQSSPLVALSSEIQRQISRYVLQGARGGEGYESLENLRLASRHLNNVIENDIPYRATREAHKRIIRAVNGLGTADLMQHADTLLAWASSKKRKACLNEVIPCDEQNKPLNEILISPLYGTLEILEPEQRTRLVEALLDKIKANNNNLASDGAYTLGACLHTLADHHDNIITTLLALPEEHKARVIEGLGVGLDHLEPILLDRLVEAALAMVGKDNISLALAGLFRGWDALDSATRTRVVNEAQAIEDDSLFADCLSGLGETLPALGSLEKCSIAMRLKNMTNPLAIHQALFWLGPVLKDVADPDYAEMLADLSQPILEGRAETFEIAALANLAKALRPLKHSKDSIPDTSDAQAALIKRIMSIIQPGNSLDQEEDQFVDENSSYLIAALAPSLDVLTATQKQQVIDACLDLNDEEYKCLAIEGLGEGLQYLDATQQARLIDAALKMTNEGNKSLAIAGLCKGLPYLDATQQQRLMDAGLEMVHEENRSNAIEGLGKGLQALVDRLHMTPTNQTTHVGQDYKSLVSQRHNAIEQLNRLVDAAGKLSSTPASDSGQSPRARALSSLASALDAWYQTGFLSD